MGERTATPPGSGWFRSSRSRPPVAGDPAPLTAPSSAPPGPFRWPSERDLAPPPPPPPAEPPRAGWEKIVQRSVVAAAVTASIAIYLMPMPAGLTPPGKAAISVFVLATGLWVSSTLPFGVTGLLAVSLLGLTGAMKATDAFAAFGNPAVFFLLGVFIIAAALTTTGLSTRCALFFLRPFERSPYAFASGMMLVAAFSTMWMPSQATTAMLFPIALEVITALRLRPHESSYAKVLLLSLGWGAMIGSNGSFLGSTRAPLALGMLQQAHGQTITFTAWMVASLPVVLLGLVATKLVLRLAFRREDVDFSAARRALEQSVASLGPAGRPQMLAGLIVGATIVAWVGLGGHVDIAMIALLGAVGLFALGVLSWSAAERGIYWNIVLMYGGAIALGVALDRSGAARWMMAGLLGDLHIGPLAAVIGLAAAALLVSEFMSNAAAVAMVLPLGFTLGQTIGVSPKALVLAASIGAGLEFALPFSSAPNTIIFASGYFRMSEFVRIGAIVTAVSLAVLLLVVALWWPVLGLI